MQLVNIPFNKPYMSDREVQYIREAHANGHLAGDGPFTAKCQSWLEKTSSTQRALLSHSCTAALEMAALLLDIKPGDEIIMPSYTFVSTANAFVLRGAKPVFIDIREDTLNMDETLVEDAITDRTRAILPVHYAGVACEMDMLMQVAKENNLLVIEDAAQGVMSGYKGRALGSIGDLGAFSFHETKNIISGEGGALLVNREDWVERAEIIREKGTDRSRFFRGLVGKYTWQDIGSSYLPGELIAAFLWSQLEQAEEITAMRMSAWQTYHILFDHLESQGAIRRPIIPPSCTHNAHMYYVLLPEGVDRAEVLAALQEGGVNAVFHYVPLHSSPAGVKYARTHGDLSVTDSVANRLIRLPLWVGISDQELQQVHRSLKNALGCEDDYC
ncbi:MAG: dTDP-4-amino-4,6-dideoxygalactose transaminase [Gammaproteobacteria bacterium]|nr:dTDP-4-amino-4,6-dideoxygalactose transaminase [Gammaproteobacteria bacterium]